MTGTRGSYLDQVILSPYRATATEPQGQHADILDGGQDHKIPVLKGCAFWMDRQCMKPDENLMTAAGHSQG